MPGRADLVGGLFARAFVRVGQVEGAIVVPPAALVRDGSDPARAEVFVVRAGKAEKVAVALGVETPDGVQATSGLAAGDQVVLDPPTALASGAPVEVRNERGPAATPAPAARAARRRARSRACSSSNLSIKHPVFATMMMAALAVLGIASYSQLKVDMFPKVEIPVVTVTTIYPGAGPETVEREVTKKIEEEINTVEGVKHIESISQEGLSNIVVEFQLEVSAINASQDVRGKIAAIRGDLPREIEEPIVQRIDFGMMPILSIGVDAPGLSPQAATTFADKVVKRRLENVRGVGSVALVGESTREIQVVVDRLKLEAYHVSLAEVVTALQRENVDVPAGTADRGATEALVRVAARGAHRGRHRRRSRSSGRAGWRSTCATSRRWSTASRSRRTRPSSTSGRPSPSRSRSSPAPTRWRSPTASSTRSRS